MTHPENIIFIKNIKLNEYKSTSGSVFLKDIEADFNSLVSLLNAYNKFLATCSPDEVADLKEKITRVEKLVSEAQEIVLGLNL